MKAGFMRRLTQWLGQQAGCKAYDVVVVVYADLRDERQTHPVVWVVSVN